MYITIGKNQKRYMPDEWQFTAYQLLNIHIDDSNMIGKPFCIKENQKIELTDTYKGKKLNHWQLPYDDNLKPMAGNIEIGYNSNIGQITHKVVILPSILNNQELQAMAKMIGDIVFNNNSFTRADFSQQINQGINNGGSINGASVQKQGGYSDYILNQLPSLFDVLEYNLPIIEKSPSLSMRAVKKEIQIHKSNKPKDLLARKLQPNKKITLSYGKSYDEYSQENKWLGYIIFEALTNLVENSFAGFQEYQKNNTLEYQNSTHYNEMVKKIDKIKHRLDKIKSNDFIKKFDLKIKRPPQITTRLIKSKGYGEIVKAYQEIFNESFLKAFEFYNDVITAYSSGYLDNLSNIYEHWCLVVLYDNLLKLGFKPDDDCRLENVIKLQDDNLVIPSESVFVLRKPFAQYDYGYSYGNRLYDNRGDIVIKLYYEPKLFFNYQAMLQDSQNYYDYLTPDIFMEIDAPQRALGITNFSLILDAKFKDYQNLDLDYSLSREHHIKDIKYFQDIMHTAMYKYHYRLNNFFIKDNDTPKPRVGMSAILSPNVNFLWQGEKPLIDCDFLQNNRNQVERLFSNFNALNNDTYKKLVSHKFGTLTLRPNQLGRNIRRLFAIIFYYHMGLTSLCLGCGRELHEENEFFVNEFDDVINAMTKSEQLRQQLAKILGGFLDYDWSDVNPTTRFRACCKNCQTQWRVSFCANRTNLHGRQPDKIRNNRIIKLGIDDNIGYIPIHHKTNEGTYCPKCFVMKKSSHLNIGMSNTYQDAMSPPNFYDEEPPF